METRALIPLEQDSFNNANDSSSSSGGYLGDVYAKFRRPRPSEFFANKRVYEHVPLPLGASSA